MLRLCSVNNNSGILQYDATILFIYHTAYLSLTKKYICEGYGKSQM